MAGRCVNSPGPAQEVSAPMRHDCITGGSDPSVAADRTLPAVSDRVTGSDGPGGLPFSELARRYLANRELQRLPLAEIVSLPQTLQQVETELAAQGLFDYLAVALPGPRSAHLDRAQDLLIDCESRPHLRHIRILASRCGDEQPRSGTRPSGRQVCILGQPRGRPAGLREGATCLLASII